MMSKRYCVTNYTTHCRDVSSGEIGCFMFDVEHFKTAGTFKAISPVFAGLAELYAWDKSNGKQCKEGLFIEFGG